MVQATEWLEAQCTTMTRALRVVLPEDASREGRDAAEAAELAARQSPGSSAGPDEALPGVRCTPCVLQLRMLMHCATLGMGQPALCQGAPDKALPLLLVLKQDHHDRAA